MSLLRTIEVQVIDDEQRLFRVCGPRDDAAFEDAFKSNYERQRPPRGPENRVAVIHMALSMFDSADIAAQIATRFSMLGDHIATVDLRPGLGLCVAKTGGPGHWSVWGRPTQVIACVADVVRVDELDLS